MTTQRGDMQPKSRLTGGLPEKVLGNIPGAKPSEKIDAWWGLVAGVVGLSLLLILFVPDPFRRIVEFVSDGIGVTVVVTVVSFVLVMLVGLLGGLGRISRSRFLRGFTTLYVEIIRGIPLLVQLLFWYYALPQVIQSFGAAIGSEALINYRAEPIVMAILGLTIGYGAYMTEVVRAGIQSVPKGQAEAARSLGLTYFQSMRYVVLPQAFRTILPAIGNEFVTLLKDSSLVSVVAVPDLTRRGREFMSMTFIPLETWAMIALLYLIMTLFAARIVNWLERKTKIER
jgi:polar amino acid transport system permease protein